MITYALYTVAFGVLKLGYADGALVCLKREKEGSPAATAGASGDTAGDMAGVATGKALAFLDVAFTQIEEYLQGTRKDFDIPCVLHGTPFQKQVWAALCAIPFGETRSYKQIAQAIGNPKACRAVGMANNKNPISIIVPCHRVIGANGALVGYASGLEMKKALLKIENPRTWLELES